MARHTIRFPSKERLPNLPTAVKQPRTASEIPHGLENQSIGLRVQETSTSGVDKDNSKYNSALETRQELIIRVKREQKLTWLENSGNNKLEGLSPILGTTNNSKTNCSSLLPVDDGEVCPPEPERTGGQHIESPANIVRPRSALHAGDFRDQSPRQQALELPTGSPLIFSEPRDSWLGASPTSPWYTPYSPALYRTDVPETQHDIVDPLQPTPSQSGNRAASYSALSSSFVFRPPTSPLAQQSNSNDLDTFDRSSSRHCSGSPERSSRRHTFSPRSLRNLKVPNDTGTSSSIHAQKVPPLGKEGTFPYQAHQPRRSLVSFSELHSLSVPQAPSARSRRISLTNDASSPLQHAPMIGRYEESILRGRMSTLPSRPLDFVAQIGVLGKGKCKSNLRCPPHITVPFPAVFYNYATLRETSSPLSGPSPYVGLVDLENSQRMPELALAHRADRPSPPSTGEESNPDDARMPSGNGILVRSGQVRRKLNSKRSSFLKSPPKGSYRIPQQGQLQIVIKNPNKTAVKLYLVPYDLAGMEAGQKTFIRQRSYSAGPVIDMPLNLRKNLGTDRPEAALTNSDDPRDRPVLRYLIHLHICCPSRGRYYLYKSIRVVFANRVPDGMEKLRNEIQLPDPLYSVYKADKSSAGRSNPPVAVSSRVVDENHGPHGSNIHSATMDMSCNRRGYEEAQKQQTWASFQPTHDSDDQGGRVQLDMSTPTSRDSGTENVVDRMSLDGPSAYNLATFPNRSSLSWKYAQRFHEITSLKPNAYTKLSREDYSKNEIGSRYQSPQLGEGLLTSQLRNFAG